MPPVLRVVIHFQPVSLTHSDSLPDLYLPDLREQAGFTVLYRLPTAANAFPPPLHQEGESAGERGIPGIFTAR
jgi:hypothetical protein